MKSDGALTGALVLTLFQFGCVAFEPCAGPNCPDGGIGSRDADVGVTDAGAQVDAGRAFDGGSMTDGGERIDAGRPRRDAGACAPSPHASAAELATTPRADRAAELLIIESTGRFVADDESYSRVTQDLPRLAVIDAGTFLPRFLPNFVPGLTMTFADAGIADVTSGAYSAWDCLNQTYDGDPRASGSGYAFVEFRKTVDVRVLVADYQGLPHVTLAQPEQVGIPASCGYSNDICLHIDAGIFTYLGWVDTSQCSRTWYRLTSHSDGGVVLDVRDAGLGADDWMDSLPACAARLWGRPHRWPDGGFK